MQDFLYRMWDSGQQHLAAGRYLAARRELEAAEAIAWRQRDAATLARLYLPLLEARRQIRYLAVEGPLVICPPTVSPQVENQLLAEFLRGQAGTILLGCAPPPRRRREEEPLACRFAGSVHYESQRTGHPLEALLLVTGPRPGEVRLAAQADPTFAAGLTVSWSTSPAEQVGPSTDPDLVVPLPQPGRYEAAGDGKEWHAQGRESLIIAWEALALKWQRRHPPPISHAADPAEAGWEEMAWLRLALRIDPACEPVSMRLMSLAQNLDRLG